MRYLTALIPLLLLFLLDALMLCLIIGLFMFWDRGGPFSYTFATKIWNA